MDIGPLRRLYLVPSLAIYVSEHGRNAVCRLAMTHLRSVIPLLDEFRICIIEFVSNEYFYALPQ